MNGNTRVFIYCLQLYYRKIAPGGLFISGPLEGRGGLIERDGLINSVPIEDGGLITRRRLI